MSNANDVLHAFILLDRSGSMASRWEEVLGAIDAYVRELGEAVATLATFDAVGTLKYEVIRDRVPSTDWKPLIPNLVDRRRYNDVGTYLEAASWHAPGSPSYRI